MIVCKRKTDIGNTEIMELGGWYVRYEVINMKSVLGLNMHYLLILLLCHHT